MAQMQTPYSPGYIEPRGKPRASLLVGSLWMVGITVALFFLPLINGLVGGFVGGYKVGGMGRALVAAIMPAIVAAIVIWILFVAFDLALWGIVAGLAVGVFIALSDLGLFIGAALGGAFRDHKDPVR